jgi:glycosyltransferase 2 family protein
LLVITTVLSLLVQGSNVLLLWLIGRAIDAPLPASYCGIVVPMVTLLTLVPVSLNGMGVREGGMVLFLTPVGIAPATALSLAFLWFSVFVAVSLFGAGVYLWGNSSRPEERADDSFVGSNSNQGRARQSKAAA